LENGVANYGHSRTGKLNSVYIGVQMAKNRTGVLTHPTGGHQAEHCHASSLLTLLSNSLAADGLASLTVAYVVGFLLLLLLPPAWTR